MTTILWCITRFSKNSCGRQIVRQRVTLASQCHLLTWFLLRFLVRSQTDIIFKQQCTCKCSQLSDLWAALKPQWLEHQNESKGGGVSACTPLCPWPLLKGKGFTTGQSIMSRRDAWTLSALVKPGRAEPLFFQKKRFWLVLSYKCDK